jgi:hypothetical protein
MQQATSVGLTPEETGRVIQESIDGLKADFERYPDVYLTEEDVRSHLFADLLNKGFSTPKPTEDNSQSIELHSEIRWYGREEPKLRCRSDIVLIDVSTLITTASGSVRLPSKQFGFNRFYTIIELKLRRSDKEKDDTFLEKVRKDIEKLEKIRGHVQSDFHGYVVIFDKGTNLERRIHALRNPHNFKIIYSHSSARDSSLRRRPTCTR